LGRDGEWDKRLCLGNPAADKLVKVHLRLVTAEQLQARVTPKQATPFFLDKLVQLAQHLDRQLSSPTLLFNVLFLPAIKLILQLPSLAVTALAI
jgi:hypothetical protein